MLVALGKGVEKRVWALLRMPWAREAQMDEGLSVVVGEDMLAMTAVPRSIVATL